MQTIQESWKQTQEMRVSASGIQPASIALGVSLSSQFGQQIRDHYRQAEHPWINHPEQILRQSGVTLNSVHQHHSLHLKPHLSLTVLNWQATAPRSVDSATSSSASTPAMSLSQPVPTSKMQPLNLSWVNQTRLTFRRITQPEQLVEQVETRKARIEQTIAMKSVVSTIQSDGVLLQQRHSIREAPLVVVKTLPKVIKQIMPESTAVGSAAPSLNQESLMSPRAIQPKSLGQMGQSLAEIDVNRLTDQVVQAIDRRLIAHRERMGRV